MDKTLSEPTELEIGKMYFVNPIPSKTEGVIPLGFYAQLQVINNDGTCYVEACGSLNKLKIETSRLRNF